MSDHGPILAPLSPLSISASPNNDVNDDMNEDYNFQSAPSSKKPALNSTAENIMEEDRDVIRRTLRRLAKLSLEDYEWRASMFQAHEADRMVEESIARILGEDHAPYLRPMDAADERLGPLGKLERSAVEWLYRVMEEEGRRAQKILKFNGKFFRPFEVEDGEEGGLGPLGFLEKAVVDFINSIRWSESERVRTNTLRPKDLEESKRGPLGQLEDQAVRMFDSIRESETLRAELSRLRRVVVRPIDVPGPLGEFEMAVSDLIQAERKRSAERERAGKIVRPKDARWKGPLGEAEQKAYETIQALNAEETERLKNIRRVLEENRPMEKEKNSLLGVLETFVVGLLRGPIMVMSVISRVQELMAYEAMSETDKKILDDATKKRQSDDNS